MMSKATLKELFEKARGRIERRDILIYDLAANLGQLVDNVKDTRWFLFEVAQEMIDNFAKYAHLSLRKGQQ